MEPPDIPRWLVRLVFGITGLAWLVLNVSSQPSTHDEMFWCLILTVLALAALAVMLHTEPDRADRVRFIRLFFIVELFISVIGAAMALWRWVDSGKRIW